MKTFATRSRVTPDAKLHVAVPAELANTDVRVTVEPVNGAGPNGRPNASFFGSGRGAFASPGEADRFLSEERDGWRA